MTMNSIHKILATALLSGGMLTLGGTINAPAFAGMPSAVQADQGVSLDLKAGQVFQIAMPKDRGGWQANKARSFYERAVAPQAAKQGYRSLGNLKVEGVVVGERKPSAVEFYAYDNAAIKYRLENDKRWMETQEYREEGWKRRDVFSTVIESDISIQFDPNKSYTLAIAWSNPANPDDYDRYLDTVEPQFETVGARFVHKFRNIDHETQSKNAGVPPVQLTVVEWDDEDGLNRLLTSDAYRSAAAYFQNGVSDFRLYRLSSPVIS